MHMTLTGCPTILRPGFLNCLLRILYLLPRAAVQTTTDMGLTAEKHSLPVWGAGEALGDHLSLQKVLV